MSKRFVDKFTKAWERVEDKRWIYGQMGKKNPNGGYTFTVPGRPTFVWVTIRNAQGAQSAVPARNDPGVPQAPRLNVRMKLEKGVYVIYGKVGREDLGFNPPSDPSGVESHNHDDVYYEKIEYISSSGGVADAGKPILTDDNGLIDSSFILEPTQDIVGTMATDSASIDFTYDDTAGTLTAAVITEAIQDIVGAMFADSSSIDITYNDAGNTISAAIIDEYVQDVVGAMFVDSASIDFTYTDASNTITATVITEAIQDIIGAFFTDSSSIDFTYNDAGNSITVAIIDEYVQDVVGAMFVDSSSIDFTYTDASNTITATVITEAIQDIVGALFVDSATLDFTYDDTANTLTGIVINNSITFAKMQQINTSKLLGRLTAAVGNVEEITLGAFGATLINEGTAVAARGDLGLGNLAVLDNVDTAHIVSDAVDNSKLANMAVNTVKGRITAGTGDPEDLSAAQLITILETATVYFLLAGRAGGQTGYGGNAANEDLTLSGTSHATKTTSYIFLQPTIGGGVHIGTTTPASGVHFSIYGPDGVSTVQALYSYGTGIDTAIGLYAPRGTQASPSATQSGDNLGSIYFGGWDTALSNGARIYAQADAEWGTAGDSTDNPTRLIFATVPDGSGALADRMVIDNAGNIGMGNFTDPQAALEVATTATAATRGILNAQHNTGAHAGLMIFRKSRGTRASPTIVANNDFISALFAQPYDGGAYIMPAAIAFKVNGTPASGSVATDIIFNAGAADDPSITNQQFRVFAAGGAVVGNLSSMGAKSLGVQAGTSSNDAAVGGVLYKDVTDHASPGTTSKGNLATYTVPADTLHTDGQELIVEGWFSIGTDTDTRTIRLEFDTDIVTVLSVGSSVGGTVHVIAHIVRTGATTQDVYIETEHDLGKSVTSVNFTRTLSSPNVVKFTGQSSVSGGDITQNYFKVYWEDTNT